MNDEPANPSTVRRHRRWSQFGLRSLLLLVLLIALALLACREYLEPYWRQQQTIALVEKVGGSCRATEVGDWWLRLLGSTHKVEEVNLADCDTPDTYVAQVAELPAIEVLIVGGPAFTDQHAQRLTRMRSLRGLILDSTGVNEDSLAALRESLNNTFVYTSQRRAIAALQNFGDVTITVDHVLSSRWNLGNEWFQEADKFIAREDFDDSAAAHLRVLTRVRRLNLGYSRITDAALEHVKGLNEIAALGLNNTVVTDAGLATLTSLKKLIYLHVHDTRVTDAGLEHLKQLPELEWLDVSGTQVTRAGIIKLQQALPMCRVVLGNPNSGDLRPFPW